MDHSHPCHIGTNSPIIAYNNVFGNTLQGVSTNYEGISDATGTSGNISADPKLANTRIGDYHIQPDSPCVNAGSSAAVGVDWTDIDGQSRIAEQLGRYRGGRIRRHNLERGHSGHPRQNRRQRC